VKRSQLQLQPRRLPPRRKRLIKLLQRKRPVRRPRRRTPRKRALIQATRAVKETKRIQKKVRSNPHLTLTLVQMMNKKTLRNDHEEKVDYF